MPSPEGFARYFALSNYNRDGSTIDAHTRELVILMRAREWKGDYIWSAHESAAKCLGVDDVLIAAIREGNLSPAVFPKDAPYLATPSRSLPFTWTTPTRVKSSASTLL